jgi:biotin operon repressor
MSDQRSSHQRNQNTERMPTQLDVVRQVMLLAAQYDTWMTLEELARKTKFPEPSISAQLRHLRKEEHGGFEVEKRRRTSDEVLRTNTRERVWEYLVKG